MSSSPDFRLSARSVLMALCWLCSVPAHASQARLDPALAHASGTQPILVELHDPAAPAAPTRGPDEDIVRYRARLVEHWQARARISQAALRAQLHEAGIDHRAYWIVNAIAMQADAAKWQALAQRADVRYIHADRSMRFRVSDPEPFAIRALQAAEWGVQRIGAPQVWAAGITGQGTVVAGQDTGIRWDHQALIRQYRGWNGTTAEHAHNWHDAIHVLLDSGSNPCGLSSPVPCDDHNHGTHTIGTVVGDDGQGNQIGVAPDARWIGCRNMERGAGRPSTYTECFQWLVAPTDLVGENPRPDLAPDVINNSWGCPGEEGCDTPLMLLEVVENVRMAGIVVVASAGNDGPSCGTIEHAPAVYDASFTVGSTTSTEQMSGFSSRGPVPPGIGQRLKPDVVAPGSSVRSATRASTSSYGGMSGTSMAGPHVAGAVALLISAHPKLRGDVDRIEQILRDTAVPVAHAQTCGGIGSAIVPNYVSGHGRIDVWAAFRVAETIFVDDFESK